MFSKENKTLKNVKTMNDIEFLIKKEAIQSYYAIPLFINGKQISDNMIYLPHGFGQKKYMVDNKISNMIKCGEAEKYDIQVYYKKKSLIPCLLVISALKENEIVYSETINIW